MSPSNWTRLKRKWREGLDDLALSPCFHDDEDSENGCVTMKHSHTSQSSDFRSSPKRKVPLHNVLPEEFNLLDMNGAELKEGAPNFNEAFSLEQLRQRRLSTEFARVMAKIAEDLAGWPVEGDDEWSVPALMKRRLTCENIVECRQSREKDSIVVILDTSGSCLPQAKFYALIASAAVQAGDVDLYTAPNAGLNAEKTRLGWRKLEDGTWSFYRRTIIFFGDYDGGDTVIESSWDNKIYWFSSEGHRYPAMSLHPWCSYSLKQFYGKYYNCNSENDFFTLIKKIT
jgi:hypothetical protein